MWRDVLDNLLEEVKEYEKVKSIFLTGSYACGKQTRYSAIELYILLDDWTDCQEYGCSLVDGYLIEYRVMNKTESVFSNEQELMAKILYDRDGERIENTLWDDIKMDEMNMLFVSA